MYNTCTDWGAQNFTLEIVPVEIYFPEVINFTPKLFQPGIGESTQPLNDRQYTVASLLSIFFTDDLKLD